MDEREPIIVGEYESIPIGSASTRGCLTREEAETLVYDLRKQFGCKNPSEWFRMRRDSVIAGGWVGVLTLPGIQVSVYPKIETHVDAEQTEAKAAPKADLLLMLMGAGFIDLDPKDASKLASQDSFIDHLAQLYNRRLGRELTRGLPHDYVERRGLLGTLRGQIDFPAQVLAEAQGTPALACVYDSFESDTRVNRILKAGLKAARRLCRGTQLRKKLRQTEMLLDEVAKVKVSAKDVERQLLRLRRNESHLRPLLKWAQLFLSSRSIDIRGDNNGQRGAGLMFRMWEVYEKYALNKLNETLAVIGGKAGCTLDAVGQIREWHLASYSEGPERTPAFQLKPDILIRKNGVPILIADTKWKTLDDEEDSNLRTLGVHQADAYQLFAYSQIITPAGQSPLPLALLYPTPGEYTETACTPDSPLGHLGEPERTFYLDAHDPHPVDLRILRFPLPTI